MVHFPRQVGQRRVGDMVFRAEKVVAALPDPLEPDTVYCVRTGTGFDLYVSDSTGATAHPLNKAPSLLEGSGRWYLNTNQRWVTQSDDNYGKAYYQFNESGGSGNDPIFEWEHKGTIIPAGRRVERLHLAGELNNNDALITDIEIVVAQRRPTDPAAWVNGFDNDGEMTNTILYRDMWYNPTLPGSVTLLAPGKNDTVGKTIEIGLDVTEQSYLSIYVRPVGTNTSIRYWRTTWTWEIS